jgi:hypothetical protein
MIHKIVQFFKNHGLCCAKNGKTFNPHIFKEKHDNLTILDINFGRKLTNKS